MSLYVLYRDKTLHCKPFLPEHPSSPQDFDGVRVAKSFVFCVVFCRSLFVLFVFFPLVIVLSVLRFTASNYPFGIFNLYLIKETYEFQICAHGSSTCNISSNYLLEYDWTFDYNMHYDLFESLIGCCMMLSRQCFKEST